MGYRVYIDSLVNAAHKLGPDHELTKELYGELIEAIGRELKYARLDGRIDARSSLPNEKVPVGHPDPRD